MINDGLAASQFQLIAEKLVHIIIILWYFILKNKVCIITVSWVIYVIFSYLGSGFRALEYRCTHCASTPLSYIMHNMATHVQAKLLLAQGVKRCSIKLSLIPIYFIVKTIVPTQKLYHEAFEMDNQNHSHKVCNQAMLNCA